MDDSYSTDPEEGSDPVTVAQPVPMPRIPAERMPPITSRFLFVGVASRRAKQLRRGALPRLETLRPDPKTGKRSESTSRMERVAMQEVEEGLVVYELLDETNSAETTS